ncbi:MAG: acyl-coenzyme A thioesterase PaaI-like protein, partial [Candidatus Aldehydirespiratoraceae bacterium]
GALTDDVAYERDGDAFVGHALEDIPTLVPMSLSRLTADLVRPVPVGERLWVRHEVIREGKKIQVVDLSIVTEEVVHGWVRALRVGSAT